MVHMSDPRAHTWKYVFLRCDNRKKRLTITMMRGAGYHERRMSVMSRWPELHKLCAANFRDGQGRLTYTWFGSFFFFLTQEDADLFETLQLLV